MLTLSLPRVAEPLGSPKSVTHVLNLFCYLCIEPGPVGSGKVKVGEFKFKGGAAAAVGFWIMPEGENQMSGFGGRWAVG